MRTLAFLISLLVANLVFGQVAGGGNSCAAILLPGATVAPLVGEFTKIFGKLDSKAGVIKESHGVVAVGLLKSSHQKAEYSTLLLFDSFTGLKMFTAPHHVEEIRSMEFTTDGKYLITSSRDGYIRILDIDRQSIKAEIPSNNIGRIASKGPTLTIAADKYLIIGDGNEIQIVNLSSGSSAGKVIFETSTFVGRVQVESLAVSAGAFPDVVKVAVAFNTPSGGMVRWFNLGRLMQKKIIDLSKELEGARTKERKTEVAKNSFLNIGTKFLSVNGGVSAGQIVVDPAGNYFVVAGSDGSVVTESMNGTLAPKIPNNQYFTARLAISRDGRFLVTGSPSIDKVLRVIDLENGNIFERELPQRIYAVSFLNNDRSLLIQTSPDSGTPNEMLRLEYPWFD